MIVFDKAHYNKFQDSRVIGTGYLAYRDIPSLIKLHQISLDKILDLGCASGRSTVFLKKLTDTVYATDISQYAISLIKRNITHRAFINNLEDCYDNSPYNSIFSFFTFLHLTTKDEIMNEYKRCFNSLERGGHLVIVNPNENLFNKKYESVECNNIKNYEDGMSFKIKLKNINCEIENCYWSYSTLVDFAFKAGFQLLSTHFPLGKSEDNQSYIEEYFYSPYSYLIFKKT